jgi:hypothetical protein
MNTKISLHFDNEDLKGLEDMLMRALVRAARMLNKEGVLGAAAAQEAPELPRPVPRAVEPPPPPAKPEKRKRRSAADVCKVVSSRPEGFITTDAAARLLGGTQADKTTIGQWVLDRKIAGVIVQNTHETPTKFLDGRLYVDKQAVIARNRQNSVDADKLIVLRAHEDHRRVGQGNAS